MLFMDLVILVVLVNFVILEMCLLSSLSLKNIHFCAKFYIPHFVFFSLKKALPQIIHVKPHILGNWPG